MNLQRKTNKQELRQELEILALEQPYGFPEESLGSIILEYVNKYGKDEWISKYIKRTRYIGEQ